MTGDRDDRLIIFVQDRMYVGGIETLTIKVINHLAEAGANVLLVGDTDAFRDSLSDKVSRYPHSGWFDFLRRFPREEAHRLRGKDITLVSLHPHGLMAAGLLGWKLRKTASKVRGFHLVTHARAFFFGKRFPPFLLRAAFFYSPKLSTYFMTRPAREGHQHFWQADLSSWPILTLPLSTPNAQWQARFRSPLHVVSVGRLVPFKAYNEESPRIVRCLRDEGIEVKWDIWGYGPSEDDVRRAISSNDVADLVSLRGVLDYANFDDTVVGYDLFVGMGTALLEAALLGVPSIVSVEQTDLTHGYLFEAPLDSIGERVEGADTIDLATMVRTYSSTPASARLAIGKRCSEAAKERSTSVAEFANAILESSEWTQPKSRPLWMALVPLALLAVNIKFRDEPK